MFNWGWIEGEFNSDIIGSGSLESMIDMMKCKNVNLNR